MDWMKPIASEEIPVGDDWLYEVKYDGFRCKLRWTDQNTITLFSKNKHNITNKFPEIINWCLTNFDYVKPFLPLELDGELVVLNHRYQANFSQIQTRGRIQNAERIEKQATNRPATLMVFDITEMNGKDIQQHRLSFRKKQLYHIFGSLPELSRLFLVESYNDIKEIQDVVFTAKGEGIVAKRKRSTYGKGKKHQDWLKIKNWREINGILTEFHPVNGYFTVAVLEENNPIVIGKCKHGLSKESLETVRTLFQQQGDYHKGVYLLPPAITSTIRTLDLYDGEVREPEFKAIEPSLPYTECTREKLELDMAQLPSSIDLTNTDKDLWPKVFTKRELLLYIREISPWMLPFLKQRALTIIRCPDGITEESFFQKNLPDYAPAFFEKDTPTEAPIICNHIEALVWMANHGSIEYHIPYQRIGHTTPVEIAFDLDPPDRNHFNLAVQAALLLKQILDDLNLVSFVKTSGNKGLQVYIPIREGSMTYEETLIFTEAIAKTLERAYPDAFTTERMKKKRNNRLYLDYVQHGQDKTLIAPYSPRMTKEGTVSTPLYWEEVTEKLDPTLFTIGNVLERVRSLGCPFENYHIMHERQNMKKILRLVRG